MARLLKIIYGFLGLSFVFYLITPLNSFPQPPEAVLTSNEPADQETPLRRGYYTDLSRAEILTHYQNQFGGFRLNYPPEEAQTLVRDQTQSTFLEELNHPLRESLYINGFEPEISGKTDWQPLVVSEKVWRQKITIRHITSALWLRLFVGFGIWLALWILLRQLTSAFQDLSSRFLKLRLWTSQ